MSVLRLRGQCLSVIISAVYLVDGGGQAEIELAREDVLERQILLQGSERLSSLMWKAVSPLLTREWDAFRVASDGLTERSPGRTVLLDSAQALIELDGRRSVSVVDPSNWPRQGTIWTPDLEDRRLEAKIVVAESLQELREPVVVEAEADDPESYAQYIPLGGGRTMFNRYRRATALRDVSPRGLAGNILSRLAGLEQFLLAEI